MLVLRQGPNIGPLAHDLYDLMHPLEKNRRFSQPSANANPAEPSESEISQILPWRYFMPVFPQVPELGTHSRICSFSQASSCLPDIDKPSQIIENIELLYFSILSDEDPGFSQP